MKKALKIVGKVLLAVVLAVYVCVALVNYSVVQSYIGAEAGKRLSAAWGGKVKIGSVHIHPFNHLVAKELLMVAPDGDTILDAEALRVHFRRFPFKDNKLELGRVYLKNAYYHLAIYRRDDPEAPDFVRNMPQTDRYAGLNLQYIINHYYKGPREHKEGSTFTVDVNELVLDHVHYKMDLPDHRTTVYDYGVAIPHMEFYDICSKITKIHVVNDNVTCRLVRFSTEERSGFKANDISGRVHVGPHDITVMDFKAETDRSVVKADVEILYDGWDGMGDYLRDVHHRIDLKSGTSVALADAAYWAPVLWGIDMQLMPVGKVDGAIDRIHTDGMSLRFGHASEVALEGDIHGLANIDSLRVNLDQMDIRFEQSDLTQVCAMMPQYITPKVARYLHDIEYIDLTSQAHGGWTVPSTVNLNLVCGLGNLRADATMTPGKGKRRIVINADSDGMGLTPLGSDWLTHSGFNINIDADVPDNHKNLRAIDAEATAYLTGTVLKGNNIDPVNLHAYMKDGKLDFAASCDDSLLYADMHGSAKLTDSVRGYYIYLDLNNLQADAFGLAKPEYGKISTHLEANFKGNSIDEMRGAMTARNTRVGSLAMSELTLSATPEDADHKNLRLESDALTTTVGGRFAYADLPLMVQHICYEMLPADLQLVKQPDSAAMATIEGNTMNFHLRLNDATVLNQTLQKVNIAPGTRIDGTYNSNDLLRLVGRSEAAQIGSVAVSDIGLYSYYENGIYHVDIESSDINVGEGLELFKDLNLQLASNKQQAEIQFMWGDSLQASHGDLLLNLDNGDISVEKPYFYIGDTRWQLGIDNLHLATVPVTTISGDGISLDSDRQHIDARLRLLRQENDFVELDFGNFDLGPISELLLRNSPVNIAGAANGRFSMYGMSSTPYFNANLTIDSCMLNRQELGELTVRSNWNAEMNTLNLQVGGNTLHATGWLGLASEDKDIDFDVDFNRFELASIAPLLSTFSSRFEGQLEGSFDINGTLRNPVVTGEAYVDDGAMKIDPTGVTYYFNDSIQFTNNLITLRDFRLLDQSGNLASVDGKISYSSLDNINIDLRLNTDNITVFNQRAGDAFYGTVLAQAKGQVRGNLEQLNISVRARTNPGTTLTVPVTDRRQVQAQDYITFVGDDREEVSVQQKKKVGNMKFNLDMDLTVTPEAQLNLPMDFSEVSVDVKGTGNGDLHMNLNESLEPQVQGSYEITSGILKFGLVSLIEKTFSLEPGSSLNFQGSLPDARFDLQAVYAQRVNLSTLTGTFSAVDNSQKYIQVEDVIAINGTLNNPTISFDIRLPNADASVEEEVFAYIDRNSERDMLNQTISLLLLGQFYNVGGNMNDNSNLLGSGLSSGYSMVASTMGNMVSDMVQIVDVDFKYKAATEMTNEQVDLNISKDWGRWYLESTLGYGGDSRELESDANGNAVIDALLGYRISDLVHIYAYNRTNNNDYTRIDLPYKQGAGLKLTKDFDHWRDLFTKKNKKKMKK
ncbi:MAG: translocation/assembly module TamB domain-containing protein [Bacteroidales bacterium]|nr:translocation/assembly module TamB domain-containing protein [Bacteroidales bacterium]